MASPPAAAAFPAAVPAGSAAAADVAGEGACAAASHDAGERVRLENAQLLAQMKAARAQSAANRSSYLSREQNRLREEELSSKAEELDWTKRSRSVARLMERNEQAAQSWQPPPPRARGSEQHGERHGERHDEQHGEHRPLGPSAPAPPAPSRELSFGDLCALPPSSSGPPFVYVIDDFLSGAECDHLVEVGRRRVRQLTKMRPLLQAMAEGRLDRDAEPGKMIEWRPQSAPDAVARRVEERIGRLMGAPPHALDGGIKLALTRFQEGAAAAGATLVPEGAHLDTHRHEHRWGTCIVYLTSLPEGDGGETCFPLARLGADGAKASEADAAPACEAGAAPAGEAGAAPAGEAGMLIDLGDAAGRSQLIADATRLTASSCFHTETAVESGEAALCDAATRLLDASERSARGHAPCGLAVRPRKGTACVFYTREAGGGIDPLSWHFGAAVRSPAAEKVCARAQPPVPPPSFMPPRLLPSPLPHSLARVSGQARSVSLALALSHTGTHAHAHTHIHVQHVHVQHVHVQHVHVHVHMYMCIHTRVFVFSPPLTLTLTLSQATLSLLVACMVAVDVPNLQGPPSRGAIAVAHRPSHRHRRVG